MVTTAKTALRAMMALGLVAGLAGCGGGGATALPTRASDPAGYYSKVLDPSYEAQRIYLNGDSKTGQTALPNTAYLSMPTSGTATYNGYALLYANQNGGVAGVAQVGVEGTAQLKADFGSDSMTGSLTDFVGGEVQEQPDGTHKLTNPAGRYDGTLTMSDGCIGTTAGCKNVTRPNQFAGTFSGTLTGQGNTVTTSAPITGDFRGTPIKGVFATAHGGSITVNGTPVSGDLTITGKP